MKKTLITSLAIAIAAFGFTGCSSPEVGAACPGADFSPENPHSIVLVMGAHANVTKPGLPDPVLEELKTALGTSHEVRLIRLDGRPEIQPLPAEEIDTSVCLRYTDSLKRALNSIASSVRSLEPQTNGNNVFAGLTLAAEAAKELNQPKIIVVDSLLQDQAPLDFSQQRMTTANPEEAADFVANSRQAIDFGGIEVELVGAGETVEPQDPLSAAEKQNVAAVWKAVLERMNAKVTITTTTRPAEPITTTFSVKLVPIADVPSFTPPAKGKTTQIVFPDTGPVHFQPGTNVLIDPQAAQKELAPIIEWLPGRGTIEIHGRTASADTEAERMNLAKKRAETIKELILAADPAIKPEQITTVADATHFEGFLEDRNADGTLNEAIAPKNRQVAIYATGK